MPKTFLPFAAFTAVVLFAILPPWGTVFSDQPKEVLVTNLPDTVQVEGEVEIVGTVQHSSTVRRTGLVVPPAERHRTADVIEVAGITTDGFTHVTLSLHGAVRGTVGRSGEVGAVLVPDEESVLELLREQGVYHFPVEVKVSLTEQVAEVPFSVQRRLGLGFPRYRVFLYNGTDRTVDVHLFAYLTH